MSDKLKIIIGSDHGGYNLKETIIKHLEQLGYEVEDMGCHSAESCDYPVYGARVSDKVAESGIPGILLCGTGIGMGITANRNPKIRAAVCHNEYTARMSRLHNNANILVMGARAIGPGTALGIVDVWLATSFEGGRHEKRVNMIDKKQ